MESVRGFENGSLKAQLECDPVREAVLNSADYKLFASFFYKLYKFFTSFLQSFKIDFTKLSLHVKVIVIFFKTNISYLNLN